MFGNAAFSLIYVIYSLFIDALNLGNRHLVPLVWVLGRFWESTDPAVLAPFQGALLIGIFGTVAIALFAVAVTACSRDAATSLTWISGFVLAIEGVLQVFGAFTGGYPTSHTLLGVFWIQFMILPVLSRVNVHESIALHYFLITGGICSALQVKKFYELDYTGGVWLFSFLTCSLFLFGFTPMSVWNSLARKLERLLKVLAAAVTWVWQMAQHAWPYVQRAWAIFWAILNSEIALKIKRQLLDPVWQKCSPLLLPALSAGIAVQCLSSLRTRLMTAEAWSPSLVFHALIQLFCFMSATNSSLVMATHAVGRIVAPGGLDALQYKGVCLALNLSSQITGAPFHALQWIRRRLFQGRLVRIAAQIVAALLHHASIYPFLAMIEVFIVSGFLLWLSYATVLGAMIGQASSYVLGIFWAIMHEIGFLATVQHSTDSSFALFVIALSQTMIYRLVTSILAAVWSPRFEADLDTLNEIAGTFRDPRQCGRCAFGPVDYDGCNVLTSHHGEYRRGGSFVSNSCPRCGWFVSTLDRWPYWDAERQSNAASCRVIRVRVWSEIVCAVRAACKALIFPYFTLRFFANWPTIGGLFGLGYLLPWFVENARMFRSVYSGGIFGAERYPARNLRDIPSDCGRRPDPLPHVSVDTALQALLGAAPDKIFMEEDTSCPICLEDFEKEAFAAISKPKPANILRSLDPAVVPLPCGHPLHMACARQMVDVAPDWQLRCPLCREPISLTGTLSARAFS